MPQGNGMGRQKAGVRNRQAGQAGPGSRGGNLRRNNRFGNGMCGKEVYSQALTDAGKPMPMYGFAKKVNLWVHKIEKFLLNGKNLGILQAGTSPAPIPVYAFAETRGSLLDFSAKHALAGVFKIGGEFGYLIVNNSIDEEDEIRVSLSQKFLSYSADGEREIGKSAVFRLAPGDAVFLKQI